jgi:hypothetical protein
MPYAGNYNTVADPDRPKDLTPIPAPQPESNEIDETSKEEK